MFKQLQIDNHKISYQVIGNGQPVMFVHGFGEDGNVWKNQIDYFADKIKMIIPDLPGSGKSTSGNSQIEKSNLKSEILNLKWTMDSFADNLHSIIEAEEIKKLTMIGHSMGGYITLAFAEKHPDRLKRFGLVHSSAYADSEEKKATRQKGIEFIEEHGAFPFLKTAIPNLFSAETKEKNAALVDQFIAEQDNFSASSLVSYYKAMMARPDRTETLRKSENPVLFIMGKYDAAVPVEHSLEQCHLPDNAYIHILRHSAHMGMLEEPHITNKALEEFLL